MFASDSGQASRPVSAKNGHVDKETPSLSNARPSSVGPSLGVTSNASKHASHGKENRQVFEEAIVLETGVDF